MKCQFKHNCVLHLTHGSNKSAILKKETKIKKSEIKLKTVSKEKKTKAKDKIVKNIRLYYEHFKNDDFYASGFNESFFKVYDAVDIHLKKSVKE